MTKTLILTDHFSAAHLYHQKNWSAQENRAQFGKCFSEFGHGHNYKFEVGFHSPRKSREDLKKAVKNLMELVDHKHLNFDLPAFKETVPTTENIAQYLLKKLHEGCPNESVSYIKLFETTDLWVEIRK